MTKEAAIQSFFESFGLVAYPAVSVPTGSDAPEFPYITYSVPTDSDLARVLATASLWYRTMNWTQINSKVRQISQEVGDKVVLECDGGAIIIRKSTPFAQPLGDDSDNMIKRKILTFEFLFATTY